MMYSLPPSFRLRASLATCLLACATSAVACGSGASSQSPGATGDDGGGSSDGGLADVAVGGDGASSEASTGPGPVDGSSSDASHDAGHKDAAPPPPAPECKTGDRKEFSGAVGTTGIDVAVCSLCGESYVVASNANATAAQVTVDNGSKMVTLAVPAGALATSANLADGASDGAVTVCATGSAHACLPKPTPNQRYCNPYRDVAGLTPERIDQGVDYAGSGAIYAMGPGTIDIYDNRTDTGWPGGTFISYKLTAGPAAGREIYLAENIDLDTSIHSGSYVYSGTVLGTQVNASPQSESGWGVAGEGVTAEYGCYTEGCMTPLGINFNKLLMALKAPSGTMGAGGCCPQPTGWPSDWVAPLAAWQ